MSSIRRLQLLVAFVAVATLLTSRSGLAGEPLANGGHEDPQVVVLPVTDQGIDLRALPTRLQQGRQVELRFEFQQTIDDPHVFAIQGQAQETELLNASNRKVSLTFTPVQLGSKVIYCTVECDIHHLLQDIRFEVVAPGGVSPAAAASRPTALTVSSLVAESESDKITLSAVLRDWEGRPLPGASVAFYASTELFDKPVLLGTSATDANGQAEFRHTPRRDGMVSFYARFEGGGIYGASLAAHSMQVFNATPAYVEEPLGITIGRWAPKALVLVLLVVWATFAFVIYQIVSIARVKA
jgi:hypothetical protein